MKQVLVMLLLCLAFCLPATGNQTYTAIVGPGNYEIISGQDGYYHIQMEGFGRIGIPGKPALPTRTFLIALPPGAEVVSLQANGTPYEIDGEYKIQPAPMQLPKSKYEEYLENAKKEYNENLSTTYSSDELFPSEVVKYEGMGNLRKWRFAYVRFSPFQYRPKSGRLLLFKQMAITINYSLPSRDSDEWGQIQKTLLDGKADDQARRLFPNYVDGLKWYAQSSSLLKNGSTWSKELRHPSVSYVIIIPDMSYRPAVLDFAYWKATMLSPDTVKIVSIDSIEAYFPGWDRVEKIRNYLSAEYVNSGLQYALLIGNISDLPMRYCWVDTNCTPIPDKIPIPTDYYYADLTGNWDSDGDKFYGEIGQDSVDFANEISVGRIPWSNPAIVEQICTKLKNFETNTDPLYKKTAMMLGSITFTTVDTTFVSDEAQIMEAIKDSLLEPEGWFYWRLYEKGGLDTSSLFCEDSLCQMNVKSEWNTYSYGYVNWSSHGNSLGAYRTIKINDTTNANPPIFLQSDVPELDDNYPSIVFSSACLTAQPETPSLGAELIKHGSAGFIGATRSAYGPASPQLKWDLGGNTSYNCYFALRMMRDLNRVGDAVYKSKLDYLTHHFTNITDFANLFVFNLYGDPAMIWQGVTGVEEIANASTPRKFKLYQNSPNPFRLSTKISYLLPVASQVTLKIYDVSGRFVRELANGFSKPGHYTTYWDGKSNHGHKVAAGVYFARFETNDFVNTKKMLLLR